MKKGIRLGSIINLIGVFSAFLLVTACAVYFYSPVEKTGALGVIENNGVARTDISLNVASIISAAVSADNIIMSGLPGEIVTSDPVRVYASTNNYRGFMAFMNDADNDTSLRSSTSSDVVISKTPTAEEVAAVSTDDPNALYDFMRNKTLRANLGENEWGASNTYVAYSLNYMFNVDDEYVVPLIPYTNYVDPQQSVDESSASSLMFSIVMVTLKSNAEFDANADYHDMISGNGDAWCYTDADKNAYEDITFTVHIGSRLAAGEYTDDIVFTVIPTDAVLVAST